ncbi:hypothetical protein IU11_16055 [Cellulosimicrobium sp. MM]|nr:hypothetical protein IU11_16055 [Cellulosimicrobium sp. MM]
MGTMTSEPTTRADAPAPTAAPALLDLDPANPFAAPSCCRTSCPTTTRSARSTTSRAAGRDGGAARGDRGDRDRRRAAHVASVLEALERSGRDLARVLNAFYNQLSADATPGLEQIEEEFAPELAAHHDAIYMDARLYAAPARSRTRWTPASRSSSPTPRGCSARCSSGSAARASSSTPSSRSACAR